MYKLAVQTRTVSMTVGHFADEIVRELEIRVLGSDQQKANDWQNYRLAFRGRAFHPDDLAAIWDYADNLLVLYGGEPPTVVMSVAMVMISHTEHPTWWGQSDLTLEHSNFTTVSTDHPATPQEEQLSERAKRLLSTFTTTMTARGRPGSGASKEQRQAAARQRLVEAGRKLQQRRMKIGRRELMAPLLVNSVDGVAEVLRVAGWTLKDLTAELNSTHAA